MPSLPASAAAVPLRRPGVARPTGGEQGGAGLNPPPPIRRLVRGGGGGGTPPAAPLEGDAGAVELPAPCIKAVDAGGRDEDEEDEADV